MSLSITIGLLLVGLVCNELLKPVNEKWHEPSTSGEPSLVSAVDVAVVNGEVLQQLTQVLTPTMDARHDRSHWYVQYLGDFLVPETLDIGVVDGNRL